MLQKAQNFEKNISKMIANYQAISMAGKAVSLSGRCFVSDSIVI